MNRDQVSARAVQLQLRSYVVLALKKLGRRFYDLNDVWSLGLCGELISM